MSKEKTKEAKAYLGRIRELNRAIDRKLDRATALKALAMKITPTMKDTGGMGGGQNKISSAMDKYIDLSAEIDRDIDRLVDMQQEAYALLGNIRNQKYYTVLELHYLKYKRFEQIGVEMGCSRRWAEKLHGRALEVFERVLEEEKRRKA